MTFWLLPMLSVLLLSWNHHSRNFKFDNRLASAELVIRFSYGCTQHSDHFLSLEVLMHLTRFLHHEMTNINLENKHDAIALKKSGTDFPSILFKSCVG